MQLDRAYKGFSFSKEGPLDMRMNPEGSLTAREIVNRWPEKKLGEIFQEYGEDPRWKRAAKAIVEARRKKSIETTTDLSQIISEALRTKTKGRLHPATLVFQALRICVNRELDVLEEGLNKAIDKLSPGGRIGVISFHRLEDRIVKNVFKPVKNKYAESRLKLITKKPLEPTLAEKRTNPRARSAKMRFAEKL